MKKVSLYLSLLLATLSASAQSTDKLQQQRFAGIDKIVDKVLQDWHTAGVAIAVVEKDKIIYAKGFGYRDYEKKLPVTPNTVFAIGSCTKAFTSGLLGILRQEGKLDFETPVRQYLPELVFNNDDLNAHVTLRDMMSHRTGLSRYDLSWYYFGATTRDSLLYRIRYMVPNEPLRYKWQYNNFMFMAQGVVAEKLTGKSWEDNIKTRIFDSLGMSHSTTSLQGFKVEDASLGYEVEKDSIVKKVPYKNINVIGPAGSINSCVNDMAKWVIAWINGGKSNGKQILPAAYVTEASSAQMPIGGGRPGKEMPDIHGGSYGLGWMLSTYHGHYQVEHGGNIDGFTASTCFYPSDSIGIIILSNQSGSPVPYLLRNIFSDRLLGVKYYAWSDTAVKQLNEMRAKNKGDKKNDTAAVAKVKGADVIRKDLKDYAGNYANNAFGKFEVIVQNDSLFALLPDSKEHLKHVAYDIFQTYNVDKETGIDSTAGGTKIKFNTDINGDIASAEADLNVKEPVIFNRIAKPIPLNKATLQKYIGIYLFGGMEATVHIKGEDQLMLDVPGQTDYTLVPVEKDKFSLKDVQGFTIEFNVNEKGDVTGLTSVQPNGRFKADKKK
ncbi:serine hydrolase [Chitinophaga ginsengisoli]|uniref:CubicO group peptidase (Beta-lactamase class C family) n=1 Tax=Chitinophaga ginsengisoli TaxID=363837 RepID=A0A2P8GPP9_9BACT|nr:serine hydrolase [Chitinophaga ginsengisoli]PSL35925.1 CubicO group peptidase (beta-lactamase class C family) [Chitinophaga ginsengisoli]